MSDRTKEMAEKVEQAAEAQKGRIGDAAQKAAASAREHAADARQHAGEHRPPKGD